MDLNQLYHQRGVAAYLARHGSSRTSREIHGAFARIYSARIDQSRNEDWDDAA
jgi:hypothetical protein